MNETVTIYSLPECERCNEIKGAFERHHIKYTDINDRNKMMQLGLESVPALMVVDTLIKDYDEIIDWMEKNNLMKKSNLSIEEWLGENNQLGIDIWNKKYRRNYESFDEWIDRVSGGNDDVKQLIINKKFLFGGRILSNRGIDMTGEKTTLSNCYVITPPEDNIESIYETCGKLARTFSYGGGCGIDISKLAPEGAKVHNQAKSTSGAVSFMDTFNQVTEQIGQNGRRGALMISIDCTHPDLEKFITVKTDLGKVTSANISVRITDDFMEAVKNDDNWELSYTRPETGEVISKTIRAKDIYHLLCKNNWDYAEPGMLFWDRIKNYNLLNTNDEFEYAGTNPCAEEPLPAGGSCLLGAINLAEFVNIDGTFDTEDFKSTISIAVRALNTVLDEGLPKHPLQEQQNSVRDWRQIGLGIMGLADMLVKMGIRYGSTKAINTCDVIGNILARTAINESALIAKEIGTQYPKYNTEVLRSNFFKEHAETEVYISGLYNSQLLTIAPTGTISTMIGVSGGIEPIFANSYTRTTKSLHGHDEVYKVYTPIVDNYMKANNLTDEADLPDYFITSANIPIDERINMQAIWQKHIDASISSTINLPHEATIEDVENLYMKAWESGLKGVTVYRAGCAREGILVTESEKEADLQNDIKNNNEIKWGTVLPCYNNVIGKKRKIISGCGSLHTLAFFDPCNGNMQEVYLSKGSTGGCSNFMTGLSRAISMLCRAGVSVYEIKDQLDSTGVCPSYATRTATKHDTSKGSCCPMAIGNALIEMYEEMQREITGQENMCGKKLENKSKEVTYLGSSAICPECGAELRYEGGCNSCPNCGWSKCN